MALATLAPTGPATLTPLQRLALGLGAQPAAAPEVISEHGLGQMTAPPPPAAPAIGGPSPGARDDGGGQSYPNQPPPPPASTITPPIPPGGGGGGSTGAGGNPLEQDPGYQAQKAEDERLLGQSASGYLSQAKDMLLGFGSQELAKSTLDQLLRDPRIAKIFTPADEAAFIKTLSDNPDTSLSTLGRLARSQRDSAHALDENLNQGNLFYSGTRAKDLGNQAYSFEGQSADARGRIQDSLSKIAESYVAAENAARQGDLTAFQAAYDRAQAEALQYGTGTDPQATDTTGDTTPTAPAKTPSKAPVKAPAKGGKATVKPAPQLISEHGLGQMHKQKAKVKPKAPTYAGRH